MTDEAAAPLHGVRVADFSRVLAGPYATMMLADFGADVVKIEPPLGDETRSWLPPVDAAGGSTYFASVNRNKRSVVCDLTTDAGLAQARALAHSADVVIENFRPGVMERFGLDAVSVRSVNPRAVYCSITGFGTGEGATLAGYDLLVQAVGGLMSVTGPADGEPSKAGVALVDVLTGMNAFSGILLALRERDATGVGSVVEVNLLSSLLSGLVNQASATLATGLPPHRLGNAHPSIAPYELFRAADRDLVIAVGNDRQFASLVEVIGGPSAQDARFVTNVARVTNRDALKAEIEARLAAAPAAHWVQELSAVGVPAGLVNDVGEAIAFAQSLGLDPVASVDGALSIANPIRLGGTAPPALSRPPRLNEHGEAHESVQWLDPDPHRPGRTDQHDRTDRDEGTP